MCEYEILLPGSIESKCLINMKKCKSSENNKECEVYKKIKSKKEI